MFECERCGSSYNANHIGVEHCPRCRLRDRVQAPLAFKAFRLTEGRAAANPIEAPIAGIDGSGAIAAAAGGESMVD